MRSLVLAALLGLAFALPARAADQGIVVEKAWARATPATQPTGAVYLVIRNKGASDDVLTGVKTDAAEKAGLHESVMAGMMMEMKPLAEVKIPAGQAVAFKPGGMHVMLMGLKHELKKGDHVALTLSFKAAGDVMATAEIVGVREESPAGPPL
jgi:copper(I)-binding protein